MTETHRPSLVGRYLMLDSPDGNGYTVSRFAEQVDDLLYLMTPHSPHDGKALLCGRFMIHIGMLALAPEEDPVFPRAQLFDDWDALKQFTDEMDGPAADRVVKLVARQDKGEAS